MPSAWRRLVQWFGPCWADSSDLLTGYNLMNKPAQPSPVFSLQPTTTSRDIGNKEASSDFVLESDSNQLTGGYGSIGAAYGIKDVLVVQHSGQPCCWGTVEDLCVAAAEEARWLSVYLRSNVSTGTWCSTGSSVCTHHWHAYRLSTTEEAACKDQVVFWWKFWQTHVGLKYSYVWDALSSSIVLRCQETVYGCLSNFRVCHG